MGRAGNTAREQQWDEAAAGCSADHLNPISSNCSGAGLGCSHLPWHGMAKAAVTPAGLCWLTHTLALDVPPNPQGSMPTPLPAHPTPLQGLARLFIDSFQEDRGSISSPAHLHKDVERRRGQEGAGALNPPLLRQRRETAQGYKYLQRQRLRRGRAVIHSPGAVKIGTRDWGGGAGRDSGRSQGSGSRPGV